MGRVPPDLTGQLSLVADTVAKADDRDEAAKARSQGRKDGRSRARRKPQPAEESEAAAEPVAAGTESPAVAADAAADPGPVAAEQPATTAEAAADSGAGPAADPGPDRELAGAASRTTGAGAAGRDAHEADRAGHDDGPAEAERRSEAPADTAQPPGETPVAPPPVELVISEVFGPTFQGEGPSLGRRAGFVRLGRCNLDCTWCDTPYTWDWTRFDADIELSDLSVDDVVARLEQMVPEIVVVTGGEPLLQQRRLLPLLQACADHGWPVEVETNGTRTPDDAIVPLVAQWNVSPKLANSGVAASRAIRPQALAAFQSTGRAVFKFVVADEDDLDEIAKLVKHHDLAPIWVMPEGTDPTTILSRSRRLADTVLARGWNFTTRLHTLLWGDTRGR